MGVAGVRLLPLSGSQIGVVFFQASQDFGDAPGSDPGGAVGLGGQSLQLINQVDTPCILFNHWWGHIKAIEGYRPVLESDSRVRNLLNAVAGTGGRQPR